MKKIFIILFLVLFLVVPSYAKTSSIQSGDILKELVFFGDSTTYGFYYYNIHNDGKHGSNYCTLHPSQIWVPKDGTFYLGNLMTSRIALSDGRFLTLAEAAREIQPKYLILTVGINGLCSWSEENFTRYYEKMIELVTNNSPNTKILLQSVYPTASNISGKLSGFTNDKIDRLNTWIAAIAERKSLFYLNTAQILKDEKGFLRLDYQNGDGLHLNTQGFNAVLQYIEKSLQS